MNVIFPDDAPLSARRDAAYRRLMAMCPEPIRLLVQPMVRVAIERASEDEIHSLMVDVDALPTLAESGNIKGITDLARRYGATDEMVNMYLPLFESYTGQKSA
jgi:hypothetical protein